MNDRKQARHTINAKREVLSVEERHLAAEKAADFIVNDEVFSSSQRIACYLARGAEIDPMPIIKKIWAQGKTCYLPICCFDKKGHMYFVEYVFGDELACNKFNIEEPAFREDRLIMPEELDLVLMPLFAFDQSGNRLGTGGGYYDRAFSFLNKSPRPQKPRLIGLAYSFQEISDIPAESWDVPMDGIVTESSIQFF